MDRLLKFSSTRSGLTPSDFLLCFYWRHGFTATKKSPKSKEGVLGTCSERPSAWKVLSCDRNEKCKYVKSGAFAFLHRYFATGDPAWLMAHDGDPS